MKKETVTITTERFHELCMHEVKRNYFEKMCDALYVENAKLKRELNKEDATKVKRNPEDTIKK